MYVDGCVLLTLRHPQRWPFTSEMFKHLSFMYIHITPFFSHNPLILFIDPTGWAWRAIHPSLIKSEILGSYVEVVIYPTFNIFCYSCINECFYGFYGNLFQEHLICILISVSFAYLFISGFFFFFFFWFMCSLMYMEQKYSAASLCSITTEVLKVLNATEELLGEAEGKGHDSSPASTPMSSGPDNRKLDQHLTKLEENVRFINRKC